MNLNFFRWMPRVKQYEIPLVFLHGMGGTGKIWRPIAAQLEEGFDCICPDQRGHGESRPVPENEKDLFRAEDYAKDVSELLDTLGVDQCFLIGHSMGVRTALALAASTIAPLTDEKGSVIFPRPDLKISGLIAVDIGITSAWGGGIGEPLAEFMENLPESFDDRKVMREYLFEHCPDKSIAQYLAAVAVLVPSDSTTSLDPVVETGKEKTDGSKTSPEKWIFPFDHQALVKTIYTANGARIDEWLRTILNAGIPVLFLRGANSEVWLKEDYEEQKLKFQHPLLTFEEWADTGHGLPFEKRLKFIERVKEFCNPSNYKQSE